MAEKELSKLKRRELLKILLIQCEEMERLQQEYEEMKISLESFTESYERLKGKLNVKDERLNQKDARIAELTKQIEEMQEARDRGSLHSETLAEATSQLNHIFEEAQQRADEYLRGLRLHTASEETSIPFESSLRTKVRKRQSLIPLIRKGSGETELQREEYGREDAMHG